MPPNIEKEQPMGLLTDDGTLVLLQANKAQTASYQQAKSLIGKRVNIMGKLAEKDGMKILMVNKVSVR
jgi:hypothetical protein